MIRILMIIFVCSVFSSAANSVAGKFIVDNVGNGTLRSNVDQALMFAPVVNPINKIRVPDEYGNLYRVALGVPDGQCRTGIVYSLDLRNQGPVSWCKPLQVQAQQYRVSSTTARTRMTSAQAVQYEQTQIQQMQYKRMAESYPLRKTYAGTFGGNEVGPQYDLYGKNPTSPFLNTSPANVNFDAICNKAKSIEEYKSCVNWVNSEFAPQALRNERDHIRNTQVVMGDVNQDRYTSQENISSWLRVAEDLKDLFD